MEGNHFKLTIEDDGKGFAFSPNENGSSGNGLLNMQNRMQQHNNSLQIITSPGKGCKIMAEGKFS